MVRLCQHHELEDAIGPSWGQAGAEHSTYEQAQRHIQIWQERGLTKQKLVLGVPFYGYGFGDLRGSFSYGDILQAHGDSVAHADLIGEACADCNYITYNGSMTMRRKVELALREGAGVMIWELSQDAAAPHDLLSKIAGTIERIEAASD